MQHYQFYLKYQKKNYRRLDFKSAICTGVDGTHFVLYIFFGGNNALRLLVNWDIIA